MTDEAHDELVRRWDALIAGLRGRPGWADQHLDEAVEQAEHLFAAGASLLAGAHEQGLADLTEAEEAELWDLVAEFQCSDADMMEDSVRSVSVRQRPVPTVRPKRPLAGGGHGPGRGLPGKREFPATWTDDDALAHTMDVAKRPDAAARLPSGTFRASGERDGVRLSVVVSPEGRVLTSYPVEGPGVLQNRLDTWRVDPVRRLRALLDLLVPDGGAEPRTSLEELMAVGEWPHVIASLRTMDLDEQQRQELAELAALTGLPPGH